MDTKAFFAVKLSPFTSMGELPSPCFGGVIACLLVHVSFPELLLVLQSCIPLGCQHPFGQLEKGLNQTEGRFVEHAGNTSPHLLSVLQATALLRDVGTYADKKELRLCKRPEKLSVKPELHLFSDTHMALLGAQSNF